MTWAADRKVVELEQKLSSVTSEFAHWQSVTAEDGALPQHNSQVLRLTRQLGALAETVSTRLHEIAGNPDRFSRESHQVEVMILDIHKIWDYFRSKLAQRQVDLFRKYLAAADDFAWACYEPALRVIDPAIIPAESVKEPPLVFLNGGWSPFAIPRGKPFEAELVPGEDITSSDFLGVLQSLPISVIGLPWYHIQHLPDAVLIGHEVGHSVEDDFGLTGRLSNLVDAALEAEAVCEDRRAAWRTWQGEIFADVYGILATGPAFVGGLRDFLVGTSEDIMSERRSSSWWSAYPTVALRVRINLAVLEKLAFKDDAARLRAAWLARFPRHAMAAFENDIDAVVSAMLVGPYPEFRGKSLREVMARGSGARGDADTVKNNLVNGYEPVALIRPVIAGARLAFEENPRQFYKESADKIVLETIQNTRSRAVRGEEDIKPLEAQDIAAGHELFNTLWKLHGGEENPVQASRMNSGMP